MPSPEGLRNWPTRIQRTVRRRTNGTRAEAAQKKGAAAGCRPRGVPSAPNSVRAPEYVACRRPRAGGATSSPSATTHSRSLCRQSVGLLPRGRATFAIATEVGEVGARGRTDERRDEQLSTLRRDEPSASASTSIYCDVSAQKRLTSANAEAKRRVEIATRRDFAAQLQKEVEVQVASAEKRVADVAKEERTADEARWRTREAEWQAARKKLEAERDRLKRELAASDRREAARAEEAVKLSETANDEHVKLQEVHAKALEDSAAKNDELRRENKRLVTQQTLLEEEVQRAEHMTRLNVIEQEETKNAMFSAVRELVPLRREVVEQRQQLVEVGRATAELQHAKEEDQAFFIAKKATAGSLRTSI